MKLLLKMDKHEEETSISNIEPQPILVVVTDESKANNNNNHILSILKNCNTQINIDTATEQDSKSSNLGFPKVPN